jgi:DNA-binding NarL/FixJ family response regulator
MTKTTRVLLVEDNAQLEQSLREALAAIDGVEVAHAAATRAEAASWLREHRCDWDLAVIDIFLREGHGFDVLRQCAGREPGRRAVVLTNYTREPVRSAAQKLGADAVFDKSFEMDEFLDYCARFASQRTPAESRA